ncbi:MAG: M36 family metallopeptidase [Gammaproteobacteria bacterium]|nr:M36 family metallopeptidase [Gammaproteobacteria bacterium]
MFKSCAFFLTLALFLSSSILAGEPASNHLPNFVAVADRLAESDAAVDVERIRYIQKDARTGLPTMLWAVDNWHRAPVSPLLTARQPEAAAQQYMRDYADIYRLDKTNLSGAELKAIHDTGKGPVIAQYRQRLGGIEVIRKKINVVMQQDLQLAGISGNLYPEVSGGRLPRFKLDDKAAVIRALSDMGGKFTARNLSRDGEKHEYNYYRVKGEGGMSLAKPVRVKPVYYPLGEKLIPAYYMEVTGTRGDNQLQAYAYVISAEDGEVLLRNNLINHLAFSYRVFANTDKEPYEDPYGNTAPHPSGNPDGYVPTVPAPQNLITLEHGGISTGDPWLPVGATETAGNNVDAFFNSLVRDGVNNWDLAYGPQFQAVDGDFRAQLTSPNTFDYAYDVANAPHDFFQKYANADVLPDSSDAQLNAKVVHAFYLANWLHDLFYNHGFDEASGNMQRDNYGRGGAENDPLIVHAGFIGTFASPTDDGESPNIVMGHNFASQSNRDATLAATVFGHEWAHIMFSRLMGGPANYTNNQSASLNEGWADFIGMLAFAADKVDAKFASNPNWSGAFPFDAYANLDYDIKYFDHLPPPDPGEDNAYYFGVRRYPYSSDFNKNPLTFKHVANGNPLPADIPRFDWKGRDPLIPGGGGESSGEFNAEGHNAGEIWATSLWQCYTWLLRQTGRYTFNEVRDRMLMYTVAALKATPVDPTFTEARDALLLSMRAADEFDYQRCKQSFGARGMGTGSVSPPRYSLDHHGVVESFSSQEMAISFISASLTDDIISNDNDGILDNWEIGNLTITLRNTGYVPLSRAKLGFIWPVMYRLPRGDTYRLPPAGPGEDMVISVPVEIRLWRAPHYSPTDFRLGFWDDNHPDTTFAHTTSINTHYDLIQSSASDDAEEAQSIADWTIERDYLEGAGYGYYGSDPLWRKGVSATNTFYQAAEGRSAYRSSMISPVLEVSATAPFSLHFKHAYKFQYFDEVYPDGPFIGIKGGGVIQIREFDPVTGTWSAWQGIGSALATGYDSTWGYYDHDIGSWVEYPAYGNESAGYPNVIAETADFGMAYAGKQVQIRFMVDTRYTYFAYPDGWYIDEISFKGIDNTPFTKIHPD